MSEIVHVPLLKPIEAHGKTITELTLRKPGGKEMRLCGVPYRFGVDGHGQVMIIDAAVVARFISMLGNVPPSTVDRLEVEDWQAAMDGVMSFFGPATQKASQPS